MGPPSVPEAPIRVLVVEDNPEDFQILQVLFGKIKHHRYELENATSLSKALGLLRERRHQAYLVDYQLGPDSGLEFLKEALALKCEAPVILLTGYGDHEMDLKAMALGAADFLNKNKLDPDLLERSIRYSLERRKAEEQRSRLAAIVETSNDAIFTVDMKGIILSWNPGAQRIYGFSPKEIGGRSAEVLLVHGREEELRRVLSQVEEGTAVSNFETAHRSKAGEDLLVSMTVSPILEASGKPARASVIVRELGDTERTERIRRDLQLERDELLARLQLQMERMPVACLLANQDFHFTYWNPAAEAMFGYSFREVEGKHPNEAIIPPQSRELMAGIFQRMSQGDMTVQGVHSDNIRKDGRIITCEWYNTPLTDSQGHFTGIMSMALDVTDRRKAEEVRSQLAAILEQTVDAVIGTDLEHKIFSWNKGAERMYGWGLEDVLDRPVFLLAPEDRLDEVVKLREAVLRGEEVSNFETVRRRKDGSPVDVSVSLSVIRDSKGKVVGVSSIARDITDRKKAEESLKRHEEQMRLAQKMDAIGRLAGGVAHDFNNLLSVVGGNAEFLLSSLSGEDPHREEAEEIQKAVKRGADLTKQLLVFSQKQVVQPQPVNLNEVGTEMGKMLKRLIDAAVDLKMIQDKAIGPILSDPGQMQQVILNLVINARDAMPQGGTLIIETKRVPLEELEAEGRPMLPRGDYVRLSVTDTGTGMTPEVQKHVFEPFFTTKIGKGTGLGLATVYGIVQKWSGHIFLHSTQGMGTTFTLYFPALKAAMAGPEKAKQISLIPQGSETLLLAEDEEPVRKVLVRTLEKFGYRVLEAADGIDAVKKAWAWKEPIDLLVTDTVMPKMNGKELADELKKTRPKVKVLFISGYPREILSQQGVLAPGIKLLQKPFELEELAREIRRILDEK